MPCAVSPFYSFNPREYPTRAVWQNPQIQLAHQFFCYAYLQFRLRVLWLKHQHMHVKKHMTGCDRHVSCPYPRNRRAANCPEALPEHGGAGCNRTAATRSGWRKAPTWPGCSTTPEKASRSMRNTFRRLSAVGTPSVAVSTIPSPASGFCWTGGIAGKGSFPIPT